jgi:2-dehydropantoate 2-reductase
VRILVFGAGAIGSLLGHRLSGAGHAVTLVGRGSYVRAVQERGLVLEDSGRTTTVHPTAVQSLTELTSDQQAWDWILLTVKAYDTREAAVALAPYVRKDAPLLMVQNGVGGEELAQPVIPQAALISGVITWPVSVLGPAHVAVRSTRGGASLAPTRPGQDVRPWARLLTAAGVKATTRTDYRAQKWSKLLLNLLANAVPAILHMSPAEVFANPELFSVERAAFLEALAVMRALELRPVSFPSYPVSALAWAMHVLPNAALRPIIGRMVARGRGDKKPSLQIDLELQREHCEVSYLNGAVVSYSEHLGLDAPINRALSDTLLNIASGRMAWVDFRGQPKRLIAIVHAEKGA